MDEIRPPLAEFLARRYPRARLRRLAGDASTRVFYRMYLPDADSRVVMDYGSAFENDTDDIVSTRIFEEADLRVPRIHDVAPEAGCLVVEDLGNRTLETALQRIPRDSAERVEELYRRAIELAAAVAVRGTRVLRRSIRSAGPALDTERFRFEMDFFVEHYVVGLLGRPTPPAGLVDALHGLADRAADTPRVLCHRDFHSRNIMVLADGSLAMVDIQDARWGPDVYDLASLVRDAYVDLDDELVVTLIEAYRWALPDPPDPESYRRRLRVVSIERMIKALGTFGYQVHVRRNERYSGAIPRTLARLARVLPEVDGQETLARLLLDSGLLTPPGSAPQGPGPE